MRPGGQSITCSTPLDAYGGGRSEQAVGRWIAARRVRPQLTTKIFNPMHAGADRAPTVVNCQRSAIAAVVLRTGLRDR